MSNIWQLKLPMAFNGLKDFLEGKTLILGIGVHWEAKKLLQRLAFSVKSDTISLFTNRGGINGILVPLKNDFKIDQ